MNVEFVGPAELAKDGGVIYNAKVDGKIVSCHFSVEALQDLDPENLHGDPLKQFEAHRLILLSAAESKITKGLAGDHGVNVYSNDVDIQP